MPADPAVHVIDDDQAVRESLLFLFASAGVPARAYESALAFLQAAGPELSGCVVTDVRMPEINGLELLQALRARGCAVPVIVITGHGDVPMAVAAMKEGACDFFEKPFGDDALLDAVRKAMAAQPARQDGADPAKARIAQLSQRERQVLDGLLEGLPNKTIAYDLGISARTVEIYRAKVMTKMGAASFAELVRMAILAGAQRPDPNLP